MISYSRELPIIGPFDVLVCGGGPAGIAAAVTTVWFGIGSSIDLTRMFRDLKNRVSNPLDNGMVTGRVALAEKAQIDAIEAASDKNRSSENKESK